MEGIEIKKGISFKSQKGIGFTIIDDTSNPYYVKIGSGGYGNYVCFGDLIDKINDNLMEEYLAKGIIEDKNGEICDSIVLPVDYVGDDEKVEGYIVYDDFRNLKNGIDYFKDEELNNISLSKKNKIVKTILSVFKILRDNKILFNKFDGHQLFFYEGFDTVIWVLDGMSMEKEALDRTNNELIVLNNHLIAEIVFYIFTGFRPVFSAFIIDGKHNSILEGDFPIVEVDTADLVNAEENRNSVLFDKIPLEVRQKCKDLLEDKEGEIDIYSWIESLEICLEFDAKDDSNGNENSTVMEDENSNYNFDDTEEDEYEIDNNDVNDNKQGILQNDIMRFYVDYYEKGLGYHISVEKNLIINARVILPTLALENMFSCHYIEKEGAYFFKCLYSKGMGLKYKEQRFDIPRNKLIRLFESEEFFIPNEKVKIVFVGFENRNK